MMLFESVVNPENRTDSTRSLESIKIRRGNTDKLSMLIYLHLELEYNSKDKEQLTHDFEMICNELEASTLDDGDFLTPTAKKLAIESFNYAKEVYAQHVKKDKKYSFKKTLKHKNLAAIEHDTFDQVHLITIESYDRRYIARMLIACQNRFSLSSEFIEQAFAEIGFHQESSSKQTNMPEKPTEIPSEKEIVQPVLTNTQQYIKTLEDELQDLKDTQAYSIENDKANTVTHNYNKICSTTTSTIVTDQQPSKEVSKKKGSIASLLN